MFSTVEIPVWVMVLILVFAAVAALDRILGPTVRWFLRRRMERVVARLNQRLERPIQPFKLARRHDMIQRLIYDPHVAGAIAKHAHRQGIPENVAFEEARRYAREIVPSFSASAYFGMAVKVASLLCNTLYRVRLGYFDQAALEAVDPDATVVFVINHRSNVDYILVGYLAAQRSALSYAVGEWAQVWPLSRVIKALGAYFIRRGSRNALYRMVLARYVRLSTDAGVTQAMFPEGGLSVTGALMPPKMGLMKYITDGFTPEGRDVVFVPVAVNYDRVLEDQVLISAAGDRERRFKASIGVVAHSVMRLLWLRIRGRYHRFGYAAVSFGAPVSLRQHYEETGEVSARKLGRALMKQVGEIVPVLPVPMISWLLSARGAMTRKEITKALHELIAAMPNAHVHMPRDNIDYAVEVGLRSLTERNVLTQTSDSYAPNPAHVDTLNFYANSIAHLMPRPDPSDSADAKQFSADAGS
jgi:glycerol-3-phosphate O-acyltransferase